MNTIQIWKVMLWRDLQLAYRKRSDCLQPLLFFIMVTSLFPLALNPQPQLLATMAPAIIWVAALLAVLLSLERLFYTDWQDGSLEQMFLSPHPFMVLVTAKIFAHWLITCVPLLLIAPFMALALNLSLPIIPILLISLSLGTGILTLIGAIGSALSLSLPQGGILLSLIVLPLFIPSLVFGAGAMVLASAGLTSQGALAWLGVLLLLALCFAPWVSSVVLRMGFE